MPSAAPRRTCHALCRDRRPPRALTTGAMAFPMVVPRPVVSAVRMSFYRWKGFGPMDKISGGVADTVEGRGKIIDGESEVGGYPKQAPTRQAFVPEQDGGFLFTVIQAPAGSSLTRKSGRCSTCRAG